MALSRLKAARRNIKVEKKRSPNELSDLDSTSEPAPTGLSSQFQSPVVSGTSSIASTISSTTTPLPVVAATASSSVPIPSATATSSNLSSHELGTAIGASVGVPIGVILLLAMTLTCLWQWKRRTGPIGAWAEKRAKKRALKAKENGSNDEVDLKKLEAGQGRNKRSTHKSSKSEQRSTPQSTTNKSASKGYYDDEDEVKQSRSKGIDLLSASLAAKAHVAAREAVQDADRSRSRTSVSNPRSPSPVKRKQARDEGAGRRSSRLGHRDRSQTASPVAQYKRQPSMPSRTGTPVAHTKPQSSVASRTGTPVNVYDGHPLPPINWPEEYEMPDPPIAPLEVLRAIHEERNGTPSPGPPVPPKDEHLKSKHGRSASQPDGYVRYTRTPQPEATSSYPGNGPSPFQASSRSHSRAQSLNRGDPRAQLSHNSQTPVPPSRANTTSPGAPSRSHSKRSHKSLLAQISSSASRNVIATHPDTFKGDDMPHRPLSPPVTAPNQRPLTRNSQRASRQQAEMQDNSPTEITALPQKSSGHSPKSNSISKTLSKMKAPSSPPTSATRIQSTKEEPSDDDISALPPIPLSHKPNTSPKRVRRKRSNPLVRAAKNIKDRLSGDFSDSEEDRPRTSPRAHRGNPLSSSTLASSRRGSSTVYSPTSSTTRADDPKGDSTTSPSYPIHAEFQRRAEEQQLAEQRKVIGQNYGKLMRDWEAGPVRRIGDGRDFRSDDSKDDE